MTVPTTFMVDTTGAYADRLPLHLPMYGAYISGLDSVPWTQEQISRLAPSKVLRYYQGVGPVPALHAFDALDVEDRAVTPLQAALIVRARVSGGIPWTTIYGTDGTLAQVATDVLNQGHQYWNGHVNCVLADWSLNEEQATALIGTLRHGMSVVGVQWASPSTNPDTVIPGTPLRLAEYNVDLSVVDANWVPSGGFTQSAAPTPVPPPATIDGVVVKLPSGSTVPVASTDGGVTWHHL